MTTFLAYTIVGIATGCIYALTASGLVVTYTTSGIFNFAHGAIGMLCAFGFWELTVKDGWPQWLALLFIMRLVGGPGWATGVGLAAAVGTLAIGRSPDGSLWGVLQYVVAGFGVDAFLWVRPALAAGAARMAALGAAILLSVGWITPLGRSFFGGGADAHTIWLSITDVQPSAWIVSRTEAG